MDNKDYLIYFAKISAINATVAGMVAENKQREILGQSMAYTDVDFEYYANELEELAQQLKGDAHE